MNGQQESFDFINFTMNLGQLLLVPYKMKQLDKFSLGNLFIFFYRGHISSA